MKRHQVGEMRKTGNNEGGVHAVGRRGSARLASGEHMCTSAEGRGGKKATYGAGWFFGGGRAPRGRRPRRGAAGDLNVAIDAVSAAVVGRIARAGVLALLERLLVAAVGDQVGAPAVVALHDGEGHFHVGAVVEAAAFALPGAEDCRRRGAVSMGGAGRGSRATKQLTWLHVGSVDAGAVLYGDGGPLGAGHAGEEGGQAEGRPSQGGVEGWHGERLGKMRWPAFGAASCGSREGPA